MKTLIQTILMTLVVLGLGYSVKAQVPSPAPAQDHGILLLGGTAHLGTGDVIENSAVAFSKGKLTFVGKSSDLGNGFTDYEKIDVSGKQVYPGLIILQSQLGLAEIDGVRATVDNSEIGDLNPSVRSTIAYNTESEQIPVARSNGVMLAQIIPQGGTISGLSSVMNLDAWNWEDAVYKANDGMWLNWPSYYSRRGYGGTRTMSENQNYTAEVQQLESIFSEAKTYKGTPANSKLAAMQGLFDGSVTLYIQTDYVKTVIESIRFAQKMGVKKIVLAGADEDALLVQDFLKENKIPVIVADVQRLPKRKDTYTKAPYELAARFHDAGVLAAVTYTKSSGSMNLPFAAGQVVPYGLTKEEALQTITLNAAKVLGIDDRAGSLEVGKDAHVVVSDGDLLDMRTNKVTQAFISGRDISLDNKHKRLYRKFATRYGQEIVE